MITPDNMKKGLYAVYDKQAEEIIGFVQTFPSEAPSIRFFSDVAHAKGTIVSEHLEDFDWLRLGWIEADQITPDKAIIITGATMKQAIQQQATKEGPDNA